MIEILCQDSAVVVCIKPIGLNSESDMVSALKEQLSTDIFAVHRLDKAVSGVMVYAKTKESCANLTRQITENKLTKEYLAVVSGTPEIPSGTLEDLLYHDVRTNKTFVVNRKRAGVKKALLEYKTLATAEYESSNVSLVGVKLITGRTHQIRVQFASRKMPLLGDARYGGNKLCKNVALFSCRLSFYNPISQELQFFEALPPKQLPWDIF